MKSFSKVLFLFIFIISICNRYIFSIQKGSETAISIEPLAIFPNSDIDNRMLAFGWFKNGFTLEDNTTSCTFDSVFPVSNNININGGLLYLNTDLNFNNFANLITGGTILGNNHLVELSETTTYLSGNQVFNNTKLFFYTNLTVNGEIKFEGNCVLNGHKCDLVLGTNGKIIIAPNSTLTIQHTILSKIHADSIVCQDNSSKLILDEIEWHQDANYTFTQGNIEIYNNVNFSGPYTFKYDSSGTSSIFSDSVWHFCDGIKFTIGRKTSIDYQEPLWFENNRSTLHLDDCTFDINSNGILITNGGIIFDKEVIVTLNSTTTANGLIFGNGTIENDPTLKFHPSSAIYFYPGHITFNVVDSSLFQFQNTFVKFMRKNYNVLNVEQDLYLKNVIAYNEFLTLMPVSEGKHVYYDNCILQYPTIDFTLTGTTGNSIFVQTLAGNGSLDLSKGCLPSAIYVSGQNNYISGDGKLCGPIILTDSSSELKISFDGLVDNGIMLNGGKIILEHDIYMSPNGGIGGEGKANLSSYNVILGNGDINWTSSIYFDGNHSIIKLQGDIYFSSNVTFSGIIEIEGNGQKVEFVDGCQLKVEKGSTLIFRNTKISNLYGNKIICSDDNSTIILNGGAMQLDGNYTFSIGKIEIFNDVEFKGSYTFEHSSNKTIKIHKDSQLLFDHEITMQLGKNLKSPFEFEDETSTIKAKSSHFKVADVGLQITKGTVYFGGASTWESDSTYTYNSIIFGNGNIDDDATLKMGAAANLTVEKGTIVYNNVSSNGIQSTSKSNRFVRKANTYYYVMSDQTLKTTKLELDPSAQVIVSDGKTFSYEDCTVSMPGVVFEMTGQRYNEYTTLLRGNDSIFINEGILPINLMIAGENNKLYGTGSISGSTTLTDSSSELEIALFGEIQSNIYLNNGTLTIDADTEVAKGSQIIGPGNVNLTTKNLYLGTRSSEWNQPIKWTSSDGFIILNSNLDLSNTWTISGYCTLDGNNNYLKLNSSGEIFIESNSTLILKNIKIDGLSLNKIKCQSESSLIIFDNSILILSDYDFEFLNGAFEISNKLIIQGNQKFIYKTDQPSKINKNATLEIRDGCTFSYNPTTTARNLIAMEESSEIFLNETTLHSTSTGIKLTCGTIKINGLCNLESDAEIDENGICFGDGISATNDLDIDIGYESTLNLSSGHFNILNVN